MRMRSQHFTRMAVLTPLLIALLTVPFAHALAQDFGKLSLRIRDPFVAPIWRLSIDRSGSLLAASSAAKALAVWSLASPARKPALFRVPVRDEESQRAHAVAINPDGTLIAYSVPPVRKADLPVAGTARIYIVSAQTGRINATIEGVSSRPQDLKFSSDGDLLGAVLSDGCGLRVWATSDWRALSSHDDGHGDASGGCIAAGKDPTFVDPRPDTTAIAFASSSEGRSIILTSGHTGLRLYAVTNELIELVRQWSPADLGLESPDGLALSPDGRFLAIGDARSPSTAGQGTIRLRVALLDIKRLEFLRHFEVGENEVAHPGYLDPIQSPGANQLSLNRVAWLKIGDDQFLIAGGGFPCEVAPHNQIVGPVSNARIDNCLVRWNVDARTPELSRPTFLRAGLDRVMDLAMARENTAIIFATARQIGAIDGYGEQVVMNDDGGVLDSKGRLVDFRDAAKVNDPKYPTYFDFAISPDAERVYFEDIRSTDQKPIKLVFDLKRRALERYAELPEGLIIPIADPLQVAPPPLWKNQRTPPEIFKIPANLPSRSVDRYRSVSISADGSVALGSSNYIRLLKADVGKLTVICELRVSAEANRINMTNDGTIIVVGHSDGTLRWYGVERAASDDACTLVQKLEVSIRETSSGSGVWSVDVDRYHSINRSFCRRCECRGSRRMASHRSARASRNS